MRTSIGRRKIIQIMPTPAVHFDNGRHRSAMLFALCDDGTLWTTATNEWEPWERIDVSQVTDTLVVKS